MQLTRTPSLARSLDSVLAMPWTAERIALERMRFRYCVGCFTVVDVMYTIEPPPPLRMCGSTRRVRRTAEKRVTPTAFCHAASSRSSKRPGGGPPALDTRMSIVPNLSTAVLISFWQPASDPTSATVHCTSAPVLRCTSSAAARIAASSRLHITTRAPSRANSSATARPRPLLDAATMDTLSRRPRSTGLSCHHAAERRSDRSAPARRRPCLSHRGRRLGDRVRPSAYANGDRRHIAVERSDVVLGMVRTSVSALAVEHALLQPGWR